MRKEKFELEREIYLKIMKLGDWIKEHETYEKDRKDNLKRLEKMMQTLDMVRKH